MSTYFTRNTLTVLPRTTTEVKRRSTGSDRRMGVKSTLAFGSRWRQKTRA